MPEMMGTGPAKCKDFSRGNGIGPFIVTKDEISDPLDMEVKVKIADRFLWVGSTSEYIRTSQEVVDYLWTIFTPPPGTIIGMGTIPGCTGLDNDLWLQPGDDVDITFQGLGTLHQSIPSDIRIFPNIRWKLRSDLKHFYTTDYKINI